MKKQKAAAWMVHLYTATGGIIGIFALFEAAQGHVRQAFLLLVLTMLIDSTDGLLARRIRVSDVLPNFSGAEVDNLVDFLTYVWVPVFIMGTQNLLPNTIWLAVPILAALYAYGQVNMKTADAFFLGFPSYWNIVALYLYWLRPEPVIAVLMVVIPAVLTAIPTRYLYPSKNQLLRRTSWSLILLWFGIIIYLLLQEQPDLNLVLLSLLCPIYYMVASFYMDRRIRRRLRQAAINSVPESSSWQGGA
ncbi:MAG: CDP-alcohol phosphatidyltransferase [Chloroflexi bacterium]|nr:CDP-alcohol phosphatidyltransferase [Chloroflexota bacterium]